MINASRVQLARWSLRDLPLLIRLNSPEMTEHLGGQEDPEQLQRRLDRYVAATGMFVVLADGEAVGSVGFWDRSWKGEMVCETGWGVVPEFQGRGIATKAMRTLIDIARAAPMHGAMHAFPSVDNSPSNAICRKLGFELVGETEFEYPKGHWMRCNDWRLAIAE